MRDRPRRRRFDDEPSGGLPIFPLILVVVLAGLLLGGVLAHFFGGSSGAPAPEKNVAVVASPSATPLQAVVSASPSATPTPIRNPTPLPSKTPKIAPLARTSASPKPLSTPKRVAATTPQPTESATIAAAPSPTPTLTPHASPAPHVAATPRVAATQKPAIAALPPAPAPAAGGDRATAIVRSYLQALTRGDRPAAAAYLAHGTPSETFMGTGSHIASIRSASTGTETYKVTADVETPTGEYYVTFTLEPGPAGLEITDHYSIKTQ